MFSLYKNEKYIIIIIFYTSVFERFKKLILIGFQKEDKVNG